MLISFSKILFLFYAPFLHRIKFSLYLIYLLTDSGLPRSGKNAWKMNFFQVREKSGNFVNGQGNLERTLKVMEKSGNLKWLCQADLENLFILFKERKRCTFSCDSLSPSPPLRATLKAKNLLPLEQILSFKSSPKI